jgi:hypothetical protein
LNVVFRVFAFETFSYEVNDNLMHAKIEESIDFRTCSHNLVLSSRAVYIQNRAEFHRPVIYAARIRYPYLITQAQRPAYKD